MQNHKDHNANHGMLWMMAACCVLPIVVLSLVGGTASGARGWLPLGLMAAMIGIHFWMMRKKRSPATGSKNTTDDARKQPNQSCH